MSSNIFNSYTDPIPPLRFNVQIIPIKQNGQNYLYFQDQYGYATGNFAVPQSAQSIFSLFDGQRSVEDLMEFTGNGVTKEQILEYVQFLDENALLHSPYFKEHARKTEEEYESSGVHKSNTAGFSYPDDEEEMTHFFDEAFGKLATTAPVDSAKALYAPHIDIRVGMNSYVKAFSSIQNITPKRVVILATSHYSGLYPDIYEERPFVISQKDFEMVNGTVKADQEAIKKLKEQIGEDAEHYGVTFQDRAHRVEHSIELHLVFLNHLWNHDFEIIPIVVGSLDELFYKADGFQGKQVENFAGLLNELYGQDDETFFLISGDLAHVGKKFGDDKPAKELFEEVRNFDESFLDFGAAGNSDRILQLMSQKYDPYRICGYPPLYSFLKTLPDSRGEILSYDIWDESERESGVSFGSILYK
ncbi:AmmeMemoRadiSam system protein B [Gracilimonas mengyeensis]|uniref:AmmeMemoRadiSam system protein B n=1 Tax=Gracilimonas mengyeensis TaxID=1302730 RepID=A0A521CN99_9BACT|nr:AmmeMemoRadiSam system protein B [Gracilimonas mengyeensis]SMO60916.1 AmmeMemoRadiSam system protein B [Gracilimonas mengyeensis]